MPIPYPSYAYRAIQKLGWRSSQNLYWSCREERNFGDWIGPLIFEKISREKAIFCKPSYLWAGHVTLTVGSVLHWIKVPDRAIVWGSGIISADTTFERPACIHAVRGPRSRQRALDLGYSCPETYGDPALLMPLLFPIDPEKKYDIGVIPHFVDWKAAQHIFTATDKVCLIDVQADPIEVIKNIAQCKKIGSSSLHGIILAHAYGIPAVRLKFSDRIKGDGVKYADYSESFGDGFCLSEIDVEGRQDLNKIMHAIHEETNLPSVRNVQEQLISSCPFANKGGRDQMRRLLN